MAPPYAELYCRSNLSFLRGASHPEELVARAAELGYSALALTDRCSVGGVVRAHAQAKRLGLGLIVGSELPIESGPRLVALAMDRDGYGNLSMLISRARRRAAKGDFRLLPADLDEGLAGCRLIWLPDRESNPAAGTWLAERLRGRLWIGVNLLRRGGDHAWLGRLRRLGESCRLPLVAVGAVEMHVPERRPLLDLLTAIRLGVPVSQAGAALMQNREAHLRALPELARFYPADLLAETLVIAAACRFSLEVIQWDKDDLAALGLLKVDCLALGILSAIRRALDLINGFRATALTLADIPPEDPAVYAMIQRGETMGVFQIESRAQMAMLPRLKPACFYDLVIEVAIVRPGPIQGDMVHPYLRRRQGLEPVTYPSEAVRAVLGRTLGVPIFQEQVIKMATVAAGFSPGEADEVRRSMAAWRRRGGLEGLRARLVGGMVARGYTPDFAEQIYQQILGFGEYGFPESHAASFALLVYVSAWLKYHEPAAFFAALIDSQPMGFYAPAQLIREASRQGVEVRPVAVDASDWDCRLERTPDGQPALRLGLRLVKGLSRAGAARLVERRAEGPFTSLVDLHERVGLGRKDLQALAGADALAGLTGNRHLAAWQVSGLADGLPLAPAPPDPGALPQLAVPTEGAEIIADYRSLGLTLRRHPLVLLRPRLMQRGLLSARELGVAPPGARVRAAGLVINRQRPASAKEVTFVTLEDETGYINLVVWPDLAERQRVALLGARLLAVRGEVQRESGVTHLIARGLLDESALLGELLARSRDFR